MGEHRRVEQGMGKRPYMVIKMTEGGTMFDLTGKKALVTGSTQGIGFAVAKAYAEAGATVYVHGGTSMEKCRKAAEQIPGSIPVICNLTETDAAEKLYDATGDIDILVLNASMQYRTLWSDVPYDEFETQMKVNVFSSLALTQKYYPAMKEKGWGRIIMVGSVQQHRPNPAMPIYSASKAAQMSLVECIAKDVAPYGVTVNNISPGVIATPRNEKVLSDPEFYKTAMKKIPAAFPGMASDCTGAFLLLASDEGRYITGADIKIDGGMSL